MERTTFSAQRILIAVAGLALALGLTFAAFAGWVNHGPAIVLSMVESGLALCF